MVMFRSSFLSNVSKGYLFQTLATLTGTLAMVSLGMHFGWPSPTIPQFLRNDSPLPMSSEESSWIVIMPCFGGIFGATIAVLLLDRVGRKVCMLLVSPIYLTSWLLIGYSNSLMLLGTARFVLGIADALAFTAFPIYVCEIADSSIRGFLCTLISIGTLVGLLLINILGSYFSITTTALISTIVPILHFLTFIWIPESPYFFVLHKKSEDALRSLRMFKGTDDVKEELIKLERVVGEETAYSGRLMDLITVESNRKALMIIMMIRGVQQFSGYTAISFYTQTIFERAGGSVSPDTATIIYISVQIIVAVLSSIMVDKIGRRPLLIVSIVGSGVALVGEGIYCYLNYINPDCVANLGFFPLVALLLYIIMYYVGLGTIPYIIQGELFPTSVKAFAMCIVDIYYSLVVALVSKVFHVMKDTFEMHVPFFGFAGCCAVGLVLIIYCVPETNRKTLENIQQSLKSSTQKNRNDCKGY